MARDYACRKPREQERKGKGGGEREVMIGDTGIGSVTKTDTEGLVLIGMNFISKFCLVLFIITSFFKPTISSSGPMHYSNGNFGFLKFF